MKGKAKSILSLILSICFMMVIVTPVQSNASESVDNYINNGQKWRIAYVEGEPFVNYASTFYHLLLGLEEQGWINGISDIPYQKGQEDTTAMWSWLATHDMGPYIEFVEDAHYDLSSGVKTKEQLINRLKQKRDMDLLIIMGTYAGTVVSKADHDVPSMVFSASNAVDSGIVKSEQTSGINHIWAHMDPERFKRQIEVFYDMFKYKKLGMVYENSPAAYSYSAVDDVKAVALEKEFEIVSYNVKEPKNEADKGRYYAEVAEAYQKLAEEVDAMYVTVASLEPERLPQLFAPFYENNVPTLSQMGGDEVKYGALMNTSLNDFTNIGRFGATNMMKILQGSSPAELPQVFKSTPYISFNLETADKINFQIPFEVLLVADEIFQNIAGESIGDAQ
ncbi:MAG: hypothetical protein FH758_12420 [Firmicutes bacterium]|nr:hypothetical protein [Bacillota bacterium]